jgi:Flp pilus assembly protein TadG
MLSRILRLRRLGADESGLALTEFAYSLPIVMVLALGGLEVTSLALAHLRVNQIAVTAADNAARVASQMDETDIAEIFAGAQAAGQAIDIGANGRVVLSSLQHNGLTGGNAGQMINWQRCYGSYAEAPRYGTENTGRTNNSLAAGMGPVGRRITAQSGTAIMFVEVTFEYEPVVFGELLGTQEIHYETAFNVREREALNISNTTSRAVHTCA